MKKPRLLSFLLAAIALIAACSDKNDGGAAPEPGEARLRVVQVEPDWANVDVVVDGTLLFNDMGYLTASHYLAVEAGSRIVQFHITGRGEEEIRALLEDGAAYTAFPCCSRFPGSYLLIDDNSAPDVGNAKIRLVDFASAATSVNIYVTAPGADLAKEMPRATINVLDASPYIEVPAGDYQVRVTPWDSKTIVMDGGTLTLGAGQVRTAIVVDAPGGGEPFGLLVLQDLN